MAKSNVKGDTFLKSDSEVVFVPNVGGQDSSDNKICLNSNVRRCMSTRASIAAYQLHRSSAETSKFSSTQPKIPQLPKSPQLISAVPSAIPNPPYTRSIAPAVKCDAAPAVGSSAVSSACSVVVQRQTKPAQTSNFSQYFKRTNEERTIPIFSERSGKYLPQLKKKLVSVTPGSPIAKQVAATGRTSFLSDVTITPIRENTQQINLTVESPKVIAKPAQIFTTAAGPQLTKTSDLKEKELHSGLMPNTSVFQKEKFFSNKIQEAPVLNNDACYRHNIGQKVIIMTEPRPTRGRPRGSRNKVYEPVCLTLSSDDEEPTDESSTSCSNGAASSSSVLLQQCPAHECLLNKSQANDGSKKQLGDQFNKPKSLLLEADEEEEEEDEMDEEMIEEEEEEDALETSVDELNTSVEVIQKEVTLNNSSSEKQMIIPCRSVRIGSFKIHPVDDKPYIAIFMNSDGFRFQVPTVKNVHEMTNISLTENDIQQVLGHFGRCLPILFIFNTPACGERIRKQLHMAEGDIQYFDPEGQDDRQKIITFLIDSIGDEHKNFLRHYFPGEGVLKEVDQKLANEILVKSTPQHNQSTNHQNVIIKNSSPPFTPVTLAAQVQNPVSTPVVIQTLPIKLTRIVPQTQVTKILTYPPPPQTGGIAITSEDLLCLDEGEFLNDVIIDFYLKYLMNEKLSETDRQRTHIFSTFFFPSLIKRLKTKSRDKEPTWTKNVDIFEKDFIIIPLNKDNHWFLAIICFPGLVPESQCGPLKNHEKSTESVSSTNDRESSESPELNVQIGSITSLKNSITTKDQSCSTDDQSSDEGLSNEVVSSFMEEPLPEAPDSSTHPDRHAHHDKMPCILIFDSLSTRNGRQISTKLKDYLKMEWDKKGNGTERDFRTAMTGHVATVPQQTNYSDCGVYVLQYVESFFENPFPYFSDKMPELPDWFPPEKVANKREEIKSLILELQKRHSSSTAASKESRPNVARKESEKVLCNTALSSATLQNSRLTSS